jgi:hypothetical protein
MHYNEIAKIIAVIEEPDGMGGYTEVREEVATIKCKVAPYTVRDVSSAGIPSVHSKNKLFTRDKDFASETDKIDDIFSDYLIEYKGVMYRRLTVMDAGKCLIIEIERVFRG